MNQPILVFLDEFQTNICGTDVELKTTVDFIDMSLR